MSASPSESSSTTSRGDRLEVAPVTSVTLLTGTSAPQEEEEEEEEARVDGRAEIVVEANTVDERGSGRRELGSLVGTKQAGIGNEEEEEEEEEEEVEEEEEEEEEENWSGSSGWAPPPTSSEFTST
jgi:hypothetical protein